MSLIKSISGIRGNIGGEPGDNLTPLDIIKFTVAYGLFIKEIFPGQKRKIIIGRDGRVSGEMVKHFVIGALLSQGLDVVDLGLATTPTVEMVISEQRAQGGIVISASHNPAGWNALKLLNQDGEFLSSEFGERILQLAEETRPNFLTEDKLGTYVFNPFLSEEHLRAILKLSLVKKDSISRHKFKVVVDGINSVGGLVIPELLRLLGVSEIIELNCLPNGLFAHEPEPLASNLAQIMNRVKEEKADLGIVVDPDVDRLAFIDEQGEMFGEEYTLVAVADYILDNFSANDAGLYKKAAVSNLSSSRALRDVTARHGGHYEAAAVGEVNVVKKMKEQGAVIGGEGNGGIIYPELHYGRDALVGLALFLSALALSNKKMSEFKKKFPPYFMVKDKIQLTPGLNSVQLLNEIARAYPGEKITTIDGVKIDWPESWVHLRVSNTEPIIRIYGEATDLVIAQAKVREIKDKIFSYIK